MTLFPSPSIGAGCRFHDDFGLAVAVEVVDKKRAVMRTSTDVSAQVDPPQPRAVEFVGVDDTRFRCSRSWNCPWSCLRPSYLCQWD